VLTDGNAAKEEEPGLVKSAVLEIEGGRQKKMVPFLQYF
jgi:hypothetical protein